MLKRKPEVKLTGFLLSLALVGAFGATGCGSGSGDTPQATPQGTVSLDTIKVGMPETVFKEAILTFVPDPKGSYHGITQYLSRTNNANGGQVIVQCKDGQCFRVLVYHLDKPVPKEIALASMKSLMPADLPPQSKVEEKPLKELGDQNPAETYYFGEKYKGELMYASKGGEEVKIIAARLLPEDGKLTASSGSEKEQK